MTTTFRNTVAVLCAPDSDNMGDHVQVLGVETAVRMAFGENVKLIRVRRDQVSTFTDASVPLVVSGWLTHQFFPDFMPAVPHVAVGVHLTPYGRDRIAGAIEAGDCPISEIGARDTDTMRWCASKGISTYFSRCLGFCVPHVELTGDKVFLVDIPDRVAKLLPYANGSGVVRMSQKTWPVRGSVAQARHLLARYGSEARLVVTSALHAAIPCIAMGIPVVVIRLGRGDDVRYSCLSGIVPVYSEDDVSSGRVDLKPRSVDVSALATDLAENLRLSVMSLCGDTAAANALPAVRARISGFCAPTHSWSES